ncbi:unnamed protein product [Phytophthora fragariaefolia]|uniref:Unnamed protein product n=1 Tax=Phytophthora fragariaefolia TaxID=1490495 RepID=A0A9W7D1K7_9STRA|nr:unnamed protein product [Phytophthora fragariaefolia]
MCVPSTMPITPGRPYRSRWYAEETSRSRSVGHLGQQTASLVYLHVPLSSAVVTPAQHPRDRAVGSALRTVSADEFGTKLQANAYLEVYNVTLKTAPQRKSVPLQLQVIITEFADVFPNELPPELPPSRSIEHEVILKPGGKPSNRAPFRLSKVEQEWVSPNAHGSKFQAIHAIPDEPRDIPVERGSYGPRWCARDVDTANAQGVVSFQLCGGLSGWLMHLFEIDG